MQEKYKKRHSKPVRSTDLLLFFICLTFFLGGCAERLYDYTIPPLQSLAAPFYSTPSRTATLLVNRLLTETAQPTFTQTPRRVSPIPSRTLEGIPTAQFFELDNKTVEPGEAVVVVNSRLAQQILVRLQGPLDKTFYLPQAGQVTLSLPAGTYQFWLVIPGQESRHGEKTFSGGYSEWVFSRTEDILNSATPRWDTPTPGQGQ